MNKVLTFVIDTDEASLDKILAAAINEIQDAGHTLRQVRVADDSGENVVAPNTVAGVNPPPTELESTEASTEAPAPSEEVPAEPAPAEEAPPEDTPVDPSEVSSPA